MASENKKRKLKNSYCAGGALKEKRMKLRRVLFFTSSKRKDIKSQTLKTTEASITIVEASE